MSTRHPRRGALAGLTRRAFLGRTSALLATAAAPPGSARAEAAPADAADLAVLRRSFDEPPAGARPMTRWWWFGGAVTPAEITRQLTFA